MCIVLSFDGVDDVWTMCGRCVDDVGGGWWAPSLTNTMFSFFCSSLTNRTQRDEKQTMFRQR